jgi:hypothetical protein
MRYLPGSFMNLLFEVCLNKNHITDFNMKKEIHSAGLYNFIQCLIVACNYCSIVHISYHPHVFISGGWSPNWVHSARRPLTGILYLPGVMVKMENLVEIMAGENEVLGENVH